MAFWLILFKAVKIKLAVRKLNRAKLNAYRKSRGLPPSYPWYEAIVRCIFRSIKYILLRAFCWCLIRKAKNESISKWDALWTSGTLANSILISFSGFLCGLFFTHLIALFLIYQLNISPYWATYGTMFFGMFLTFALAFSELTRLYIFLTVPQFFTRKGRAAILAYAIILAVSGPGKNTTHNMEVLTESIICTQEMAKNATSGLVKLVKDPMTAIGKAMRTLVDTVMEAANEIQDGLKRLMKVITSVVKVIHYAFEWLRRIVYICNEKVGSPFDKCWGAFEEAANNCREELGQVLAWMCNVVDVFQNVCYVTKVVDLLCWLPSLIKNEVLKPIKQLLKNFMASVKTFFDVRIPLPTYKFDHSLVPSKKFKEIIHDMKLEVTGELQWLLAYFDWLDFLVSIFLVLALYKAIIYRHRFLFMDRHDNFYITKGLVKLDWARKRVGKQFIFPLPYRESREYVQTYSFTMIKEERTKLRNSLILVTLGAAQVLSYFLLDFGLFLFLELIRRHGALTIDTRNMLGFNVKITGTGFMADMYRAILKAVSPIGGLLPVFDTSPCLPIPSIPDYIRYAILVCLILFCYLATLTEPYLMRLRHIICGMYYPERKGHRDRWLYTHILNSRGNFLSYARSQLKSRQSGDKIEFRVSLLDRLSHTVPGFRFLVSYFGTKKKQCFLCGKKGDLDDSEDFFHCPICGTIYCMECYNEMGKKCPAHSNAFDSSGEISEEQGSGSSDSDNQTPPRGKELVKKFPDKKQLVSRKAVVVVSKPKFVEESDQSSRSELDDDQIPLTPKKAKSKNTTKLGKIESSSYSSKSILSSFRSKFSQLIPGKKTDSSANTSKALRPETKVAPPIKSTSKGASGPLKTVLLPVSQREKKYLSAQNLFPNTTLKGPEKEGKSSVLLSKSEEIPIKRLVPSDTSRLSTNIAKAKNPNSSNNQMKSDMILQTQKSEDSKHLLGLGHKETQSTKHMSEPDVKVEQSLLQSLKSVNLKPPIATEEKRSRDKTPMSLGMPPSKSTTSVVGLDSKLESKSKLFPKSKISSGPKVPVSMEPVEEATKFRIGTPNIVVARPSKKNQHALSRIPTKSSPVPEPIPPLARALPKTVESFFKALPVADNAINPLQSELQSKRLKLKHVQPLIQFTGPISKSAEMRVDPTKNLDIRFQEKISEITTPTRGERELPPKTSSIRITEDRQGAPRFTTLTRLPGLQKESQTNLSDHPLISFEVENNSERSKLPTIQERILEAKLRLHPPANVNSASEIKKSQVASLKLHPYQAFQKEEVNSRSPRKFALANKGDLWMNQCETETEENIQPDDTSIRNRNPDQESSPQPSFETVLAKFAQLERQPKQPPPRTRCKKQVRFATECSPRSNKNWRPGLQVHGTESKSWKDDSIKSRCPEIESDSSGIEEVNMYEDEVDLLDKNGICHHHQDATEEVYEKYDEVLSELESTYNGSIESESQSLDTTEDSTSSSDTPECRPEYCPVGNSVGKPFPKTKHCCGTGAIGRFQEQSPPQNRCTIPVNNWLQDSAQVQQNVSSGLADRVQNLDSFYLGMPFPPHCNIYKDERL